MTSQLIFNRDRPIHTESWGSLQWLVGKASHPETGMTIGRVTFAPGQSNPLHTHPNCDEVLHVQQGSIEHSLLDGSMQRMEAGDSIVIPKGLRHFARNVGKGEAVVLVIFNSENREVKGE